tara:strand:- start:20 stop:304 length:285 start_codon:yes stop_codon:yes gene_type:complete
MFKGKEELESMNKGEVMSFMKDVVYPNRTNGELKIVIDGNESYQVELTGTDMSEYRPTIDDKEYTWGELKRYPNPLLRILAYRLWQKKYGSEEE